MRELILTEDFEQFLLDIQTDDDKYVDKMIYVLNIIRQQPNPSKNFLRKLTGIKGGKELFEVRVSVGKVLYRILCFFPDENFGDSLVLLNGFKKQDDKTLKKHTSKAVKLINDYSKEERNIITPKASEDSEQSNKPRDDKG